ncbi:MAG TPA: tautomerase family protein [Solirubrobacteraceae bacterium]|nr:tautomerase family protein [Solirubrobacteraceae bacterium]
MPLVEIDLVEGRSEAELDAISDAVHEAMVAVLDVPQRDRFQIITERRPGYLRFDPSYLDIDRDEGFLLIRVTLSAGRATDAKQAFYRRLAELLAERTGMRTENLAVVLLENEREDWSFGRGQASYLELPREAWR